MTKKHAMVLLDADNTLWDTDAVFANAQLKLLGAIEKAIGRKCIETDRLAFVRAIDQSIAERHHAGLRYSPELLVHALADALSGEEALRAARLSVTGSSAALISDVTVTSLVAAYFADLSRSPTLRLGVKEGLLALQDAGCTVLIVTESAQKKVAQTAEELGIAGLYARIVEGAKRADLYRRVLRLAKTPDRAFMIGDQLDKDIGPARSAGLVTIFFPGGFKPRWSPDVEKMKPDHVVVSFSEVPAIVLNPDPRD